MGTDKQTERVRAHYWIETAFPPALAAEVMAGEQSSGTFVVLPGETPELRERAAARVERIEVLEPSGTPSLPGAGQPDTLAHPAGEILRHFLFLAAQKKNPVSFTPAGFFVTS